MWWKRELELRRQAVANAKQKLVPTGAQRESNTSNILPTASKYIPGVLAGCFAAGAFLGPKRALKIATLTISGVKLAKSLTGIVANTTGGSGHTQGGHKTTIAAGRMNGAGGLKPLSTTRATDN